MRNPQVAEVVLALGVKTQLPAGVFRYRVHLGKEVREYFGKCQSHYAVVTNVRIDENQLSCRGATIASSESMSHAVIYEYCDWVKGVIHIHNLALWQNLLYRVPTTAKGVPYGSPEMAYSIIDLLKTTDLQQQRIFVMEGHEEGVFTFGSSLEEAASVILHWLKEVGLGA